MIDELVVKPTVTMKIVSVSVLPCAKHLISMLCLITTLSTVMHHVAKKKNEHDEVKKAGCYVSVGNAIKCHTYVHEQNNISPLGGREQDGEREREGSDLEEQ